MCGRFSLKTRKETLIKQFGVTQGFFLNPRYNIAPGENIPVIKQPGTVDFLRWGFIPSFRQQEEGERGFINIRAETISEKISFRQAFLNQRCLILADGYYEWKLIGRTKQPFYIHRRDNQPFAIAGLWARETCGIITQAASAEILRLHARMPVIFPVEAYRHWLDKKTPLSILNELLVPIEQLFEIYPVTPQMNRVKFDSPLCIQPL